MLVVIIRMTVNEADSMGTVTENDVFRFAVSVLMAASEADDCNPDVTREKHPDGEDCDKQDGQDSTHECPDDTAQPLEMPLSPRRTRSVVSKS